ncbi:MAG: cytochrome P450 [Methylococcaceae bacterium]|nr:cytochrome P450 [Methylococcaceae bacterium]
MSNNPIPQVKGDFLLGSLRHFKHNALQTMIAWQQDYGDLVEFNLGFQRFYLLSHPNLVEQALVQQSDVFVKMYNPAKPKGLALIGFNTEFGGNTPLRNP